MFRSSLALLTSGLVFIASFSSSSNYQLNSYGISAAGTNTSSSSTYYLRGSLGDQANGQTASPNDSSGNGPINTSAINTPPAPSLSNNNNTYYNKLLLIINASVDPSDATYSVEVSTNDFSSYSYLQASGVLGSSPVYQSYSAWGGSSGILIVGLANSTTYQARVDAQAGQFSDTNYSAYASTSTVAPTITFGVSPNNLSLGNLLPSQVTTSSNIALDLSTNGNSGGAIYVYGLYGGLYSNSANHLILASSGNLSSLNEGFGIQASNTSATSGGPLVIDSPYNGTGDNVGSESTTPTQFIYTTKPIISGSATANALAINSKNTPSANDYSETLTFIGAANY